MRKWGFLVWMGGAMCTTLCVGLLVLHLLGRGVWGVTHAAQSTARIAFGYFWLAYSSGALVVFLGPSVAVLTRHRREFGLAFAAAHVFHLVTDNGAWVPGLWRLEVANILEMGVRRGRHDADFRDATLADLALLPVRVDPDTDRQAWGATAQLAARQRLTLYDAAYLELARRRGLPLATLDRELRTAASDEGVALLGK